MEDDVIFHHNAQFLLVESRPWQYNYLGEEVSGPPGALRVGHAHQERYRLDLPVLPEKNLINNTNYTIYRVFKKEPVNIIN